MSLQQRLKEASAPGGDLETIRRIVRQRAESAPDLATTVRLSALTRTLDEEVVGVLWRVAAGEDAPAAPGLEAVFGGLGFVMQRSDGQWVMHDIARQALLAELREEGSLPLFAAGTRALYALFVERAESARAARRSALRAGAMIYAASPARFDQVMRSVDGRSLSPAIEVVHLATQFKPDLGVAEFRAQVHREVEGANALAVEGLTLAAERILGGDGELADADGDWEIRLTRVDLHLLLGKLTEAEELVRPLTVSTIHEPVRDRALEMLFTCLTRQSREREALEVAQLRLAVSPDDNFLPRFTARLEIAQMQAATGQLAASRATCETLVAEVAGGPYSDLESGAWALAAEISVETGRRDALELLITAFDRNRRQGGASVGSGSSVVNTAVSVLRASSPEVLTSVLAEAEAISSLISDGAVDLGSRLDMLRNAGRTLEAMQLVQNAGSLAPPSTLADWGLRQTVGDLLLTTRQLSEAADLYNEIIAAPAGWVEPLHRAAAVANRGLVRLHQSSLDEAEADLQRAYEMPLVSDHPVAGPIYAAALALVKARRGFIRDAKTWLEVAFATESQSVTVEAMRFAWSSEVHELAGDLEQALLQRRRSLELYERARLLSDAVDQATAAVRLAIILRRWPLAGELHAHAGRLLSKVEAIDRAEPRSDVALRAARAIIAVFDSVPVGTSSVDGLDELSQCALAEPRNWWLGLNIAYGSIRLGLPQRAWESFDDLAMREPELMALPVLKRCHAQSVFHAGEEHLKNGEAARSLVAFEQAVSLDDGALTRLMIESRTAFALAALGRHAEALSRVEQQVVGRSQKPLELLDAHCLAAMVDLLGGESEKADTRFDLALGAAPVGGRSAYWAVVQAVGALAVPGDVKVFADHLAGLRMHEQRGADMTRFIPTISTPVPDGWFVKQSVTLLAPDGQANIITSSEPLDPSIDTEQYASVQGDLLLKEFSGYVELDSGWHVLENGEQVFRRHFSWETPDGVRVTQIQMYASAAGTGYTATATTPTSQFDEHHLVMATVLQGLAFNPADLWPG